MQIIQRINHNAALAVDGQGHELVVLGKGIGFPAVPYELTDMSKIVTTFYDVESRFLEMIAGIPQQMLLASADLVEQAEINLDCDLNTTIVFTLADHLNFAVERTKKGVFFETPLAYDVAHLYPREYELGQLALDIVEDAVCCRLPDIEAVNIAMHIINAEVENGDVHSVIMTLKIITDIDALIEQEMGIKLERTSFQYSRFTMHVRYLIQRLEAGNPLQDGMNSMLGRMNVQYPEIYTCAQRIAAYFSKSWNWNCTQDEIFYMMIHLNRLKEKNSN